MKNTYYVGLWASRPGTNDDQSTAFEFTDRQEAREAYLDPSSCDGLVDWIEREARHGADEWAPGAGRRVVEGDLREVARQEAADARAWGQELAVQAGMGLGIEAYNELAG